MIPSLLLQAVLSSAALVPGSVLASLASATAGLEYALSADRRRAVLSNLEQIARSGHPLLARRSSLGAAARSIFKSYHRFLFEYFAQSALDADALDHRFRFQGMERVYGALSLDRGAVVAAPHLGNWELAGIALSRLGFRVHVVTGVQFHARWTRTARALKERERIRVSHPREGYSPLVSTLRGGGIVVLLVDGNVYLRSVRAPFFGRTVPFPLGPALLARRASAPLLHAHAEREARGCHLVSFDGVEHSDRSLPLMEDLQRLTRRMAEAQERAIAMHLDQWCIFRPIFRDADAA